MKQSLNFSLQYFHLPLRFLSWLNDHSRANLMGQSSLL
jgi:hypothetical protein